MARRLLIIHSVTVADVDSAIRMSKYAYGVKVFEAVLARGELAEHVGSLGFRVRQQLRSLDYDLRQQIGVPTSSETWVCERVEQ